MATDGEGDTNLTNTLVEAEALIRRALLNQTATVNLSHRQLTILPPSLASTASFLACLHLNNNFLILPPSELLALTGLTELTLDHNRLTLLPSIGALTNLEVLNLSENPLTCLPADLPRLFRLQQLWVNNIQLTHFPITCCSFASLQKLSLARNSLTSLPDELVGLSALKWLSVEGNSLRDLSVKLPQSLVFLNASRNLLTAVSTSGFSDLSQLQTLQLRGNHIATVKDDVLLAMAGLSKVDLRDNPIAKSRPPHWKAMLHILTENDDRTEILPT